MKWIRRKLSRIVVLNPNSKHSQNLCSNDNFSGSMNSHWNGSLFICYCGFRLCDRQQIGLLSSTTLLADAAVFRRNALLITNKMFMNESIRRHNKSCLIVSFVDIYIVWPELFKRKKRKIFFKNRENIGRLFTSHIIHNVESTIEHLKHFIINLA